MCIRLFLGWGILLGLTLSAQDKPQLKARELFYTPIAEAKATPPAKDPAPKSATTKPAKPKPGRSNLPDESTSTSASQVSTKSSATLPDGSQLQNATTPEVVGPPLALKYRLLKRSAEGRYDEVDTDTVFRSGDMIRVSVESNDNGYLYIVQQGSSKTWTLLFPNEATEHGNNRVQRNREYDIPGGGRFTFDEQPGAERMFIVLTRRPEPDLEKMIYSLSKGESQPASVPSPDAKPKMMLAQSRIDDSVINRLRGNVLARDLVFEKVNEDTPAPASAGFRKEKALYVATPDRTPNARLVVDLTLKHQ